MSGDMYTQSASEETDKYKTYLELTIERTEVLKKEIIDKCPSKFYHQSEIAGCKMNTSGLCFLTIENCPIFFSAYVAAKANRSHIWE